MSWEIREICSVISEARLRSSMEEGHSGEHPETQVLNRKCSNGNIDNGDDELWQTVIELGFQNEYLKSQFKSFQYFQPKELIESLNKQLGEERQTRVAAEEALKHLQVAQLEADAGAHQLSLKLAQGQKDTSTSEKNSNLLARK